VRGWGTLFTGKGYAMVTVGDKPHRRSGGLTLKVWNGMIEASDVDQPVLFIRLDERGYWRFEGRWYVDSEDLSAEEIRAVLVTRGDVNRAQTYRPAPSR
jgi:hypothetical protein